MLWWTLRQLRSKDRRKRQQAASKLQGKGNDRAVEPLLARLTDDSYLVREAATLALGKIGDRRAVTPLVALLSDPESRMREASVAALQALGWQPANDAERALLAFTRRQWDDVNKHGGVPLSLLIGMINAEDHSSAMAAIQLLGESGDAQAVPPLLSVIEHNQVRGSSQAKQSGELRGAAEAAIKRIKQPAIVPLLIALTYPTNIIRERARALLLAIAPNWHETAAAREAVPALIEQMSVSHVKMRVATAELLGKLGDRRAAKRLAYALADADASVRNAAAAAMIKLGPAAIAPLIDALRGADARVAEQAAVMLGKMGDAIAVEPLIAALNHSEAKVVEQAAFALGQVGGESAATALEEMMRNSSGPAGVAAIASLAKIRQADAIKPLSAALDSPDASVRKAAAESLGTIGDTSAVRVLIRALADKQREVCRAVAKALKTIDDQWASSQEARDALPKLIAAGAQIADEEAIRIMAEAIVAIDPDCLKSAAASRMNKRLAAAVAARQRLIEQQRRKSEAVRLAAAVKNAKTIEPLIEALGCEDWQVRKAAVEAMAALRDANAIAPLSQALTDDAMAVQNAAVEALARIGGPQIVKHLLIATKEKYLAESVNNLLKQLLESIAKDLSAQDLQAIANLANLKWQYQDSVCVWNSAKGWKEPEFFEVKQEVDYSQLRQLARQELIRRGLEA